MTANRSSLLALASVVMLALAAGDQSAIAQAHGGGNGSSVKLPASFPADVHMPLSTYTIISWNLNESARLHSDESVSTLISEYNTSMTTAGWQGTVASQGDPSAASGSYQKGDRFLRVALSTDPRNHGSRIELDISDHMGPGADFSVDGGLAGDVHRPADASPVDYSTQMMTIMLRAAMPMADLQAEYDRTMMAAGWQKTMQQIMPIFTSIAYTKPVDQRSVNLTIKPSREGHGLTGLSLLISTTHRVPMAGMPGGQ